MKNPENKIEAKTNVVVISWNALDFTRIALERLVKTVKHPYFLTVVDNGSSDGTKEYLDNLSVSDNCIGYRKIINSHNVGPGAAYSQGYEISKEIGVRYTALCNNDLYFQNQWLEKLEMVMDNDSSIGILGTLQPTSGIVHPSNTDMDAKQIIKSTPSNLSAYEELDYFFQGNNFDAGAKSMVRANGGGVKYLQSPPDAVPTSCAIVRNSAIEKVGFIADPRYEIYGSEDIDLSWELGKLGYKCAVSYDTYIHHFRHRSASVNKLDINKCLMENNKKLVKKWLGTIAILLEESNKQGVKPDELMGSEHNKSFLKLRRINDNVKFWKNGKLQNR